VQWLFHILVVIADAWAIEAHDGAELLYLREHRSTSQWLLLSECSGRIPPLLNRFEVALEVRPAVLAIRVWDPVVAAKVVGHHDLPHEPVTQQRLGAGCVTTVLCLEHRRRRTASDPQPAPRLLPCRQLVSSAWTRAATCTTATTSS
jgi:hypothetical protein